uniref:Uncharacterized protein n=1 Tax=Arundo donax TaxID=35708 RepID=A0A0A9HAH9_ARUDO
MQRPSSHRSVQNRVSAPLPTSDETITEKRARTWSGTWIGRVDHGRFGSVF